MINNLQNILTQDHLHTESPVFCVYSKQETCVDSEFEYDKIVYIKNSEDYPELSYTEFEELEEEYEKAIDSKEPYPEMPKDPCSGEDFHPYDWDKRYIKFVDKFEQAFFIRQNAENYIRNNSHNLGEGAFVYVESAYRNSEWQAIRKMLVDKALIESSNMSV